VVFFITTTAERDIVYDGKEKLSYIAFDIDTEMKAANQSSDKEMTYELPDGNIVTVGSERFGCREVHIQSGFIGMRRALSLTTTAEHDIICDGKEKLSYIAFDIDFEMKAAVKAQVRLYQTNI